MRLFDSARLRNTLDFAGAQLLPKASRFVPCVAVLGTVWLAQAIKSMSATMHG